MIKEEDIRRIYEGFYKIAEEMNESDYTEEIGRQLRLQLTNRIAPIEGSSDEIRKINEITRRLEKKYRLKFEQLEKKQKDIEKKLETKVK